MPEVHDEDHARGRPLVEGLVAEGVVPHHGLALGVGDHLPHAVSVFQAVSDTVQPVWGLVHRV